MITIRSNRHYGFLSKIKSEGTDKEAFSYLNPIGVEIVRQLEKFNEINPKLKILRKIIMPDHVHFILYATQRLEYPIGVYIAKFKGNCTRIVCQNLIEKSVNQKRIPLFEDGFNDKILTHKGQLKNFMHYIDDNPRRLWIRIRNPEYFHKIHKISFRNKDYNAFGNCLLLDNPVKSAVIVSSKYSDSQREAYYNHWREVVRQRGVLIGAFVSREEKRIKYGALSYGASVIEVLSHGFAERYKPNEDDLQYCAEGRILQIAMNPYTTRKVEFTRQQCLDRNEFALNLANASMEEIRIIANSVRNTEQASR